MKKLTAFIQKLEWIDSLIGIIGVSFILFSALFVQIFDHESPCPLCLLQRAALIGIGLSLLMNIRFGNRAAHWGLAILSALTGMAVSMRQIALHVNDPAGFAEPILGLHLYTWCFLVFFITLIGCALMLIIYPEKNDPNT